MTVKQLIQAEIDQIPEEKLNELYELIKQFNQRKNSPPYHDLDHLAGTWNQDDELEFITNTKQFQEIENKLWQ